MKATRKPMDPERAYQRLADLCARSEQCTYDLRQKMRRWLLPDAAAVRIIARLKADRFVDDSRFAQLFVSQKYQFDRWGRKKIMVGLMGKHIERDIINSALDEAIEPDIYEENLRSLLRAKIRSLGDDADSYDGRTRLFRYGVSRGYEPDLVIRSIKDPSLWQDQQ